MFLLHPTATVIAVTLSKTLPISLDVSLAL